MSQHEDQISIPRTQLCTKSAVAVPSCNLITSRMEMGGSLGFGASLPRRIKKFQAGKRPSLDKQGGDPLRKIPSINFWPPHAYTHGTHIHIHKQAKSPSDSSIPRLDPISGDIVPEIQPSQFIPVMFFSAEDTLERQMTLGMEYERGLLAGVLLATRHSIGLV